MTDPVERQALINAFTINETYFFREDHQLRALSTQILPAIVAAKRPGDLVRIWSLPCSTGDEPYSIAIWLLEHWPMVDAYNIEIVGSDIDTAAIAAAREGRYAARALNRLPADLVERYFEPEHRHHRKIIDDLRESVQFSVVNLIDPTSAATQGRFDIILCRNLLIYFDDASRKMAGDTLYERLQPGGFLCLGHSESMARISDRFDFVRLDDAIVYRRP
jgi:chemotaxis protein methyltransferase CheR